MEKSIMRMITVLYRKSQSCLNIALNKYNLTTAEQPIFTALQRHDGAAQEKLSSLISVDKAAVARAVKSLEEKGYVRRVQDEHDKRQNRVFLTDRGKEYWPKIKQELGRFNGLLTQNIDKNSLDIIYNALLKMEENAVNLSMNKNSLSQPDGAGNGNDN